MNYWKNFNHAVFYRNKKSLMFGYWVNFMLYQILCKISDSYDLGANFQQLIMRIECQFKTSQVARVRLG